MSDVKLKLSDAVSLRMIQIFQEAIMTGVDGADLMRMVRLRVSDSDPETLVLDPVYVEQVKAGYERMLHQADELRASVK